jgi:hypothetical protein
MILIAILKLRRRASDAERGVNASLVVENLELALDTLGSHTQSSGTKPRSDYLRVRAVQYEARQAPTSPTPGGR